MNNTFKQERIMTAVVGSHPKPNYLFPGNGRKLLDTFGMTFYDIERKIGTGEFKKRLDRASMMAIRDQNLAGIHFITDGEERRDHYVLYVLRKLDGFDFEYLKTKSIRNGIYVREVPTVMRKIAYKGPIVVDDYLFTKKYAKGIAKIGLPGPSTVVDSVVDEYYNGDLEQMAMDYAKAIHHEVKHLIDADCRMIQFDDPVLLRYPEKTKKWGLKALKACFQGLEKKATYIVHICRGYSHKQLEKKGIPYKADEENYRSILSWLRTTEIDVVSIEGAEGNLDLSILKEAGEKKVMLGVVDVGTNKVERVESLVKRGQEALNHLPKNQLILSPDCGMVQLTQTAARRKLKNIATAASILNKSL